MRIILLLSLFFLGIGNILAQKDSLAIKYNLADEYIFQENFDKAAKVYESLLKNDRTNPVLNFQLGFCRLKTEKGRFASIESFESAIANYKKDKNYSISLETIYFYLGQAYHKNYIFDQAILSYEKIKTLTSDKKIIKEANREIKISKTAEKLFFNQKEMLVQKLGVINSKYADHSPVITADESVLIFTSTRKGSTGGKLTENKQYYEDVYIYDRKKGYKAKPENIGPPINTPLHEATCGLSVDGQEMFIYRSMGMHDGNIYYSKLEGEKWTKPVKLGKNVNSKKRETHATISPDGKYLYFSSNRKGGKGGSDIYVSKRKANGKWGKAKNLGKKINTKYNEEGPYMHPDGRTLYFASEGHPGMGGFDIFYSELQEDGTWGEPQNMGSPLNTVDDDIFYVPTAKGNKGYYSSYGAGGSDIYIAQIFNNEEKIVTIVKGVTKDSKYQENTFKKSNCYIKGDTLITPDDRLFTKERTYYQGDSVVISHRQIKGNSVIIKDSIYEVPENTIIYVLDAETKELENSYSSNSVTGKYLFVLNERKNYKIYFEAENHIFDTKDIALKDDKNYKSIYYEAEMDTIIHGKVKKSKKIGFKKGLTSLNKYTSLELDILSYFLQRHPDLYVNISGYDYLFNYSNRDFFRLEFEFAEARKTKVIDYLIKKGVNENNIFVDMFPANIFGDTLEYTIFDEVQLSLAKTEKEERRNVFLEVKKSAEKTEEEIIAEYGLDTLEVRKTLKFVEVSNIKFDLNRYTTNNYKANIDTLAKYLKDNPTAIIELSGHTDLLGANDYNLKLSGKRVKFVKDKLIAKGVRKSQIKTVIYASEHPIAKNKMANGNFYRKAMKYNRRVEIKVVKQGENANLFVNQIKVPKQYQDKSYARNTNKPNKHNAVKNNIKKIYAVCVEVSKTDIGFTKFKKVKGITQKKDKNGNFIYYTGGFEDQEEALDMLTKLRTMFPKAFIFVE